MPIKHLFTDSSIQLDQNRTNLQVWTGKKIQMCRPDAYPIRFGAATGAEGASTNLTGSNTYLNECSISVFYFNIFAKVSRAMFSVYVILCRLVTATNNICPLTAMHKIQRKVKGAECCRNFSHFTDKWFVHRKQRKLNMAFLTAIQMNFKYSAVCSYLQTFQAILGDIYH